MPLIFYPHTEDAQKGTLIERIEVLMEAAEKYKAIVLDTNITSSDQESRKNRRLVPRDQQVAFNWEEIARILREVRELPEINKEDKNKKATMLTKLAEVYEALRAAKMAKLEAVRLALINEANQLNGQASVA